MTDIEAAIAQAVALHHEGRLAEAEALYLTMLEAYPDHAGVLHNLGVVVAQRGDPAKALDWFEGALAARLDYPSANLNKAGALFELGRLKESANAYKNFLAAEPNHYDARFRLGLIQNALGHTQRSLACFARTSEIRRGAATVSAISKLKLEHDIAQFRFMASAGIEADRVSHLADQYTLLIDEIEWPNDDEPISLTDKQLGRIAATFASSINIGDAPEIPGSSLHSSLDVAAFTRDYAACSPGMALVDNFLAPNVLGALRRYLLHSTIWFDFTHVRGFLAAYLEDGLACPLLLQIAADLRTTFPELIGNHILSQAWAFKCVGGRQSIDVHMDAAAVSVNFWITPNAANRDPDHGGLVLYDTPPPSDWRVGGYGQDIVAIREFLARKGSQRTIVPYRENRAIIFDSNLFHESDTVDFKSGYENHRINITLLFGQQSR